MRLILLVLISLLVLPAPFLAAVENPMPIAKLDCPDECGGIKIPYPFGIGDGCFYHDATEHVRFYEITCNDSFDPPIPIYGTNIKVLSIILDNHSITVNQSVAYDCYNNSEQAGWYDPYMYMVEFTVSTKNKFVAIGCDTKAYIEGTRFNKDYFGGCISYCTSPEDINNGTCSGAGCCMTPVPDGITNVSASLDSYSNHSESPFNPCSSAFIVDDGAFNFTLADLTSPEDHFRNLCLPMVFDWWIINANCTSGDTLCGSNTNCDDLADARTGYRCKCLKGYRGNPYLPHGCQDVNECLDPKLHDCERDEYCENKIGGYDCKCPKGSHGNATKSDPCKADPVKGWKSLPTGVKVVFCIGIALIAFLVGGILLYHYNEKKKLLDLKERCFQENGGLILHEKLSGREISVQKFKIFTAEELEKATAYFNESNVIGRGGFGMVYKGTLPDGQDIAIKKSIKVDPTQIDQFVNEILVLSEINNRHIVKLLGCCLETEVPLLVYEFINNGTLYEHLHDERKASLLSWDTRLSIAEAVASVLSYLHTTIATPIIHRDMKSMNILLNENYTAKVSDFGASKLAPLDGYQVATMVLGTHGYLDPEYLQTHVLTEKSDVYSFGVVLAELLTRKKAICPYMPEAEKSLAIHFILKMKQDCLFDIVDSVIVNNDNLEQLKEVTELAKQCLSLRGDERPTMKEVAMELEAIKKMAGHPCHNVAAEPEESQWLLGNALEVIGCSTNCTTTSIPTRNMLQDLEDGR